MNLLRKRQAIIMLVLTFILVMGLATSAYADATTPTSLLDPGVQSIIEDFAADLTPTVLAIVAIVVPTGLAIWAIAFGIKKGIAYLQRRAQRVL